MKPIAKLLYRSFFFSLFLPIPLFLAGQVHNIIPEPQSCIMHPGTFNLSAKTTISIENGDSLFMEIAEDFVRTVNRSTGYSLIITNTGKDPGRKNTIILKRKEGLEKEAYRVTASSDKIIIEATFPNGLFYGTQTVLQLFPAAIYSGTKAHAKWSVPCCEIRDEPALRYRGLMVDVCRHFMPKEEIMKIIDIMAIHKQNIFHWHLTDDQGWRIEIQKYPRLTQISAFRKETAGYEGTGDGIPHGGFYTQNEIKEVVEYARRRYITVIPEIELPGHAQAVLAAYPQFSCFPERQYEVATTWGIKKDVFCPNAATFRFLEDVFTELFDLFPSPFYHIGGDECPRDRWKECPYCQDLMKVLGLENEDQLQIFFVKRIEQFLSEKGGKEVIGWDEILDGGAVPSTIALSYRGHAPGVRAIHQGMRTIFTPNRWCYLDYYQEDMEKEPQAQALFLPLSKVYNYNPVSDTVPVEKRKLILGMQGCIWTEFIPTQQHLEYMAFPRAIALSEVEWTPKKNKDFTDFCCRLAKKGLERLDMKKIHYSKAFFNVIFHFGREEDFPKKIEMTLDCPDTEIRYTTDGTLPTRKSPLYSGAMIINRGDTVKAQGFYTRHGGKTGKLSSKTF